MLTLIEELKEGPLRGKTEDGDPEGGNDKGHPEAHVAAAEHVRHRVGHEGADHIQGAVCHVGNPQDPQDEGQARRDDEKDDRAGEANEYLAQ